LSNLGCGGGAGTDEAGAGDGFSVNDEEDALARGFSNGDPTRFVGGVLVVGKGGGERVVEDRHRFGKRDAVFLEIAGRFAWVVLEG